MGMAGGKFLTFKLCREEYAIPILSVKEIIGIMDITEVPGMPPYYKGLINLRGRIVPVVDLRLRFGMEAQEYDNRTCIIVIDIRQGNGKKQIGIIVDTVSEVVNIQGEDIEKSLGSEDTPEEGYIYGIGKIKGKIIILLDLEKVLKNADDIEFSEMLIEDN